ncbi:MAG: septum formation initiator family protein [Alphaproteobacteria bacterium]
MNFIWFLQKRIKMSGFLIACILVFVYFSFYSISGERGLLKYLYLKKEIAQAQKMADQYNQKKEKLEEKVKHLSSSSLDLDLLDERVRTVLNFVADDEFIIIDEE